MKRLLKSLVTAARTPTRPRHQASPAVERLEERLAPAVSDMTQLAKLFAPHAGPTHLYLNFDGDSAHGVSAFTGTKQDKEEILFRTSEIFAPFNVQVSRRSGNGNFGSAADGHTTVFIGDNTGFKDANGRNVAGGVTPGSSTDYPGQLRGDTHQLNGDPYDVAYVDPVAFQLPAQQVKVVLSNADIAVTVAHEAGHTFGLAHVLGGQVDDIMSYNSGDRYFAAQALPVTNLNYSPKLGMALPDPALQPSWMGSTIVIQNSYTTLQAALGHAPLDNKYHVVHTGSVDTGAYQDIPFLPTLSVGQKVSDKIQHAGEYDVYYVTAPKTGTVTVNVTGAAGGLVPVLLAYDFGGTLLPNGVVETSVISVGKPASVQTTFTLTANHSYFFVVGGVMGNSVGSYTLSLIGSTKPAPVPPAALAAGASSITPGLATPVAVATPTPGQVNIPTSSAGRGAVDGVSSMVGLWFGPSRTTLPSDPSAIDQLFAAGAG